MRSFAFVSVLLVGCVTPKPAPAPTPPPPVPAIESVPALLAAAYAAFEAGDTAKLEPLLDENALVWGLGPMDTWPGRAKTLERLEPGFVPLGLGSLTAKVEDSKPSLGVSRDGASAWVSDFPRVTTERKGQKQVWLPRITAHAQRTANGWRFDAVHVSLPVDDQLLTDATRLGGPPTDVPNDRSADADQLVGLVRRALDDYGVKVERTSESPAFSQVGTSLGEVFVGGPAFKQLLRPQLGAIKKAGYTWKLEGNLRVQLAPGGGTGWAAAVVVQRMGNGKKQQVYPPFRFLWTFVEDNGVWNIASEHQSLAVVESIRVPATEAELTAWKAIRDRSVSAPVAPKPTGPDIGAW